MHVVGCFLEYNDKFVILHRHIDKPDGDTWGLPGGKVENGETVEAAIIRELQEETGYLTVASELELLGNFEFVTSRDEPLLYSTHRVTLSAPHEVKLEQSAHTEYKWVSSQECYSMNNLIWGFQKLLDLVGYAPDSTV